MIKNWSKFFESSQEEFTEEMSQEILYTFGENSTGYGVDTPELKSFLSSDDIWYGITFYETGYDEMKKFTQTLLGNAKNNEWVKSECIKAYNFIRKQNDIFPHIYEIEDMYLSLIENYGYNFYVDVSLGSSYTIRLIKSKRDQELSDFISMYHEVEKSLNRIKSNKYSAKLFECLFDECSISFKIRLKRDWSLS